LFRIVSALCERKAQAAAGKCNLTPVSEDDAGMADVFFLHARRDKARVVPLVAAIETRGWSVWWDPERSGPGIDRLIVQNSR
jgi:hypothetical protein